MRNRILPAAAFAAAFVMAAFPAIAADYRAEADQLAGEIIAMHPHGREIAESERFKKARADLLAMAGDTDVAHYAIVLGRMFAVAEDGHTNILGVYSDLPEFAWRYPIAVKRFEDGLYVIAAKDEAAPLLGRRLVAINGAPIDDVVRRFAETMGADNSAWPTNWAAQGVMRPGWMVGLDIIPADLARPVRFTAVDARGRKASAMLRAREDGREGLTDMAHAKSLLSAPRQSEDNYLVRLQDGKALALVIGAMEDAETRSFEAFTKEAAAALDDPLVERVVIDLRDNGGGNNMLAEPLRRILVKSRFNRPGGLYVLTAPQTFSAAMNFATRLERETDALFVGEPTGGAPNHFGDPQFKQGEASTLPYIISTLRWQDSPPLDRRRWIMPDIPAAPRLADYVDGRDRALDAALAHQPDADMVNNWWRRAMEPWDRASQKENWRFFWEARDAR